MVTTGTGKCSHLHARECSQTPDFFFFFLLLSSTQISSRSFHILFTEQEAFLFFPKFSRCLTIVPCLIWDHSIVSIPSWWAMLLSGSVAADVFYWWFLMLKCLWYSWCVRLVLYDAESRCYGWVPVLRLICLTGDVWCWVSVPVLQSVACCCMLMFRCWFLLVVLLAVYCEWSDGCPGPPQVRSYTAHLQAGWSQTLNTRVLKSLYQSSFTTSTCHMGWIFE